MTNEQTPTTWKKADLAAAKGLKEALDSNKVSFLELKVGQQNFASNLIRIAPPHPNMETFFVAIWVHFGVGPEGRKRTVGCPSRMFGEICPICDYAFYLKDTGHEEQAKKTYAKPNYLMNAFRVEKDGDRFVINDEKCYTLGCGGKLFGLIWDEFDPDSAGNLTLDLTDVESGYVLNIKSHETDATYGGKKVAEHKVQKAPAPSPFPNLELLKNIKDLTEVTEFLKPEAAMALLSGAPSNAALAQGDPWKELPQETAPTPAPVADRTPLTPEIVSNGFGEDEPTGSVSTPQAVPAGVTQAAEAAVAAVPPPNAPPAEAQSDAVSTLKGFLAERSARAAK